MVRRAALLAVLALAATACTSGGPSGTFSEIAVDTAAPSPPRTLLSGGWEFGLCAGYCRSELLIRSDGHVLLEITDRRDAGRTIRSRGALDPTALEEAEAIATGLNGSKLKEVYGCPDCADGGAGFIRTWGEDPARSTYDFREPPPELAGAHRFVGALIAALETCESTDAVAVGPGCAPRPST